MKKYFLSFLLILCFCLSLKADLHHRIGAQFGGLYMIMGFSLSASAIYQVVFHRNIALEIEKSYNYKILALAGDSTSSGGLDVSLQAMLYNFGEEDFSKGFAISIGSGLHYLQNNNFIAEKQNFLVIPLKIDFFYQYLFNNNWLIKAGLKSYIIDYKYKINKSKIYFDNEPKFMPPAIYFGFAYSF